MHLFIFLLWLVPGLLSANALMRFLPSQAAPVPALWWAIDSTQALPIASISEWFVASASGQPAASVRPLPADGVGIGLLAAVPDAQGDVALREIMPPWPLDASRVWPIESRHRHVSIDQARHQGAWIELMLPLPGAEVLSSSVSAELRLPRDGPAQGPYRIAVSIDGADAQTLTATDSGGYVLIDLTPLLSPWPLAEALQAMLSLHASADTPWALATVTTGSPALWRMSWQSASAVLTGRLHWQRALTSLLLHTGARAPVPADLAEQLNAQVQGHSRIKETQVNYRPMPLPAACGGREGLMVNAASFAMDTASADMSAQLTHWLDAVLEGPTQPYRLIARHHAGQLIGTDVHYATPRLGRARWLGDHDFRACRDLNACASSDAHRPSLQALAAVQPALGEMLSDEVLGSDGQLTTHPHALAMGRDVVLGDAVVIDSGADPSRITGREQYLLWLGVDGTFFMRDGNNGELLWRWQPSVWRDHRARLQANPAAQMPQYLSPHAVQLWSGEQGERIVYAVLAGHLVALDVTLPRQPKLLALAPFDGLINSVTILPALKLAPALAANESTSLASNSPELLLSVRRVLEAHQSQPSSASSPESEHIRSTHLLRINGRTGAIVWRADYAHDDPSPPNVLVPQWHLPWRFIPWQEAVRGYGVDAQGRTWRLQANASTGQFDPPVIMAEMGPAGAVATPLASPTLSVQSDDYGRRRVAIALVTQATPSANVVLSAWLDDERPTPLTLASLPAWSSTTAPPSHRIGWQRSFSASQRLGLSPQWLDARVILTLETAHAPLTVCTASEIQTRLYELPWRGNSSGIAKDVDLGTSATRLAEPVLSDAGDIVWLGQTKPETGLSLSAYRRRISKTPEGH